MYQEKDVQPASDILPAFHPWDLTNTEGLLLTMMVATQILGTTMVRWWSLKINGISFITGQQMEASPCVKGPTGEGLVATPSGIFGYG